MTNIILFNYIFMGIWSFWLSIISDMWRALCQWMLLIFQFSLDQFRHLVRPRSYRFWSTNTARIIRSSQTHHRRPCFVFGSWVVDSPSGNRETAVAPRGNRNRVWKYERNAEGRKEDKYKEDKNASFKTYGEKKKKEG